MKRFVALFTAVATMAAMLAGCGQAPSTPASTAPSSGGGEAGGTIVVWADPSCYAWLEELSANW